jgi:glycosyltransferase involved in cell wall biosynthesis
LAGTPDQIVDGATGPLVEPADDALARALSQLVADPPTRARLRSAGRRRFEELFTPQAAVARYLQLDRMLLQESWLASEG